MKKQLLLLLGIVFLCSSTLFSQEEKEMQYILSGPNRPSISGFGGPFVDFSAVEGEFAVFVGGGGALLLGQTFYFGGYGEGLATSHYRYDLSEVTDIEEPKISFGHGGFWLGYINNSFKAIHPAASLKLGWGNISVYDDYYDYDHENYVANDGVFVLIPQLEMEMNLTSWFKLNVGAGYRWVTGMDKQYYDQQGGLHDYYKTSDYSSPVGTISFLFGGFGVK